MTLDHYLSSKGISDAQLAEAVGVTQPHIWRIRQRYARPSPDLARKIEAETGIPASDLVFVQVIPPKDRVLKRRKAA